MSDPSLIKYEVEKELQLQYSDCKYKNSLCNKWLNIKELKGKEK